jgi:polysaccharide export outer membrane protein
MYLRVGCNTMCKLVYAFIVLVGVLSIGAVAQDAAAPASDTAAAKPVLPSSDSKAEAKATPLPTPDTPAPRVSNAGPNANMLPDGYVIGIGDGLDISVWKEGDLSKQVGVRPDGMITLPLLGEIKVVGLTPNQLQEQLTAALSKVLSDPQVTVGVVSINSLSFNIMGNVLKPGYYPLNHPVTILDAIALSGGFRDFAKEKKIYILRPTPDGKDKKIYFNYKDVIRGRNMAQNILLEPRDTLVVP